MKFQFTLVYQLPDDWVSFDSCLQELGNSGLCGGGYSDDILNMWFVREADTLLDAVIAAKEAVAEVMPEAKYIKAVE